MRTIKELAQVVDPAVKRVEGLVRRMVVTIASAKATWQVTGFRQLDGSTETRNVETFTGIGIFARPPGNAEAIVIMVGDGKVPVAIAVRDEKTRATIAGALKADETALFNSQAVVHITDEGRVEVRSANGTAVSLMTLADGQAMRSALDGHTHTYTVSGSPFLTTFNPTVPEPVGTTVLKGE